MIGNKDEKSSIEKIDEVLVPDGPSQAGEIIVKNERSVERALEEFVIQANASQAEDYDGWDIASNIDKFVEQARSQPGSAEPPRPRLPLPGVAPFQDPPAPSASLASAAGPSAAASTPGASVTPIAWPVVVKPASPEAPASDGKLAPLPFAALPSIPQGGISRKIDRKSVV